MRGVLLLGLALLLVFAIHENSELELENVAGPRTESASAPRPLKRQPQTPNKPEAPQNSPFQNSAQRQEDHEERQFQSEYQNQIIRLARNLETNGLSPALLDEPSALPPETEVELAQLKGIAHKLTEFYLKKDGKTWDDIQPLQETKLSPEHEKHAVYLKSIQVSPQVDSYVESRARAERITTEDVDDLIQICSQERDCIERGVMTWLDANHLLSEEQLSKLEASAL